MIELFMISTISMAIALALSAIYEISSSGAGIVCHYIGPAFIAALVIIAVGHFSLKIYNSCKLNRIKRKVIENLPLTNSSNLNSIAHHMMQDKDLDKIVSAYALASAKFPNSIDYDLITVARELVEGRDLSRYSKKNDFIYYQDGENESYMAFGTWVKSKETQQS